MGVASSETVVSPIAIVVDDDAEVRDSLEELLSSVRIDTLSFSSAQDVLNAKLPDCPSCIVLDVRMPGLSGMDLQRLLATKGILTPIIFLTGHGDIAMGVEAMKAGAADFLTKPVRDQTILDAVAKAIAADTARRAGSAVARKSLSLYRTLTPREQEVLRFVVSGAMNKQIAFQLGISEVTVKLHRGNMMKKMNARSVSHLFNMCQSLPTEIRLQLKMTSPAGNAVVRSSGNGQSAH